MVRGGMVPPICGKLYPLHVVSGTGYIKNHLVFLEKQAKSSTPDTLLLLLKQNLANPVNAQVQGDRTPPGRLEIQGNGD